MSKCFFALLMMLSASVASASAPSMSAPPSVRRALTLGLMLPQPISVGYETVFPGLELFHFFAEGGYFSLPLSSRLKNISTWSIQAGTRYFPLQNWLYLSGSLGFRQIGVGADISSLKMDGVSLANDANLTLNSAIIGLCVGGQWNLNESMALTFEAGAQLPLPWLHGGKTTIVQDVPDGTDLSVDDSDALYRISGMPVPQIALVRFIWYVL